MYFHNTAFIHQINVQIRKSITISLYLYLEIRAFTN
jgi:hypothetical protein